MTASCRGAFRLRLRRPRHALSQQPAARYSTGLDSTELDTLASPSLPTFPIPSPSNTRHPVPSYLSPPTTDRAEIASSISCPRLRLALPPQWTCEWTYLYTHLGARPPADHILSLDEPLDQHILSALAGNIAQSAGLGEQTDDLAVILSGLPFIDEHESDDWVSPSTFA